MTQTRLEETLLCETCQAQETDAARPHLHVEPGKAELTEGGS